MLGEGVGVDLEEGLAGEGAADEVLVEHALAREGTCEVRVVELAVGDLAFEHALDARAADVLEVLADAISVVQTEGVGYALG